MTDAPALPSLQDDATVTSRTDREVYTIRQQDIGFEAVGATLARTLERELAAALAERNALQLALNAASGRADALEVALQRIARWFGEFPATGRTWDDGSPMSYAAAWGSNGERDYMREVAHAALSTTPESPYLAALREYFAAKDAMTDKRFDHEYAAAEQRCRTLLADPQPDTNGQTR